MKKLLCKCLALVALISVLSNCARDLSSDMYTSDSTQSFTMEGQILSVRAVKVKESEKLGDNAGGVLGGGALGAALGSNVGGSPGSTAMGMIGGALIGGTVGAVVQDKLGQSQGYEYIVKLNRSKIKDGQYYDGSAAMRASISTAISSGIITVVQGTNELLHKGQKVYVIISDKRARVIPAN